MHCYSSPSLFSRTVFAERFPCVKNALNLNSFQFHCLLSDISECKYDHIYVEMPKLGMLSHAEQQTRNSTDPHILPLPGS